LIKKTQESFKLHWDGEQKVSMDTVTDLSMALGVAIAVSVNTRAKPILLTVLAIIFASALLATDPVFGGLGVALIGGTLAAYGVSLFIVPIIIQAPLYKQYKSKQL